MIREAMSKALLLGFTAATPRAIETLIALFGILIDREADFKRPKL